MFGKKIKVVNSFSFMTFLPVTKEKITKILGAYEQEALPINNLTTSQLVELNTQFSNYYKGCIRDGWLVHIEYA